MVSKPQILAHVERQLSMVPFYYTAFFFSVLVTDPLDDIPDGTHKDFIRDYMKAWPYPPLSQYSVGRPVNIELNGVLKKCEVVQVDSSLIQVVFQVSTIKYCS